MTAKNAAFYAGWGLKVSFFVAFVGLVVILAAANWKWRIADALSSRTPSAQANVTQVLQSIKSEDPRHADLVQVVSYLSEREREVAMLRAAERDHWMMWLADFVRDAGIALFIAGIVGVVVEIWGKKHFLDEIYEHLGFANNVSGFGLRGIFQEREQVGFMGLIDASTNVSLIVASTSPWGLDHRSQLKALMKRNGHVDLFIPNPENDDLMNELALRFGHMDGHEFVKMDVSELKSQIHQQIKTFKDMVPDKAKKPLKIWLMNKSPVYSCYLFDKAFVFVAYKHRVEHVEPTYYLYGKGTVLEFYKQDLKQLRSISKELSL